MMHDWYDAHLIDCDWLQNPLSVMRNNWPILKFSQLFDSQFSPQGMLSFADRLNYQKLTVWNDIKTEQVSHSTYDQK
jgi:hypothetical protein